MYHGKSADSLLPWSFSILLESQKLFSHLATDDGTFQHRPISLLSSISLIAGTTIGAGILALPAATLPAGLLPSTTLMVGVWLYMAISGLLIAEVNLQTMQQLGQPYMGFMGTVRHHLGKGGFAIAAILYVFNHYALLIAYTARGGDILASALSPLTEYLSITDGVSTVSPWWGHSIFIAVLGSVLFFSSQQFVGRLNSALLTIVLISFLGLLTLTAPQVQIEQWANQQWSQVSVAIPVMFVAFVYHNVVPVITTQLEGDRAKVRQSILLGSLIPLVLFLLWNAVILGSVLPTVEPTSAVELTVDPIERLRSGTRNPQLGLLISVFSEFAIITSFIGFVYGLLNFFEDIIPDAAQSQRKRLAIYALVLIPPIVPSVLNPDIFFDAIDLAGAFGVSILFGIIPAVMVWKQRYQIVQKAALLPFSPMVGGGKAALSLVIGLAMTVFVEHFLTVIGGF